jgi:hypothetical protein
MIHTIIVANDPTAATFVMVTVDESVKATENSAATDVVGAVLKAHTTIGKSLVKSPEGLPAASPNAWVIAAEVSKSVYTTSATNMLKVPTLGAAVFGYL